MKTSSDHFHVCSTVGIESLPKRCIYPSWSLLYSIRLLILRERNNMWIEIEIEIICEFPCLQSGGFSHNKDQHTLHSLNAPRVDQHIFWKEGFISFLTYFFIVFPNSLFCVIFQIFLRPPIGTKTDSECSAGRDLFHVFLKYSCFPKKAAAPAIFNYFNKILQQKHTVLEEADDTKCLCWELFLEIFLMTQLLCKNPETVIHSAL